MSVHLIRHLWENNREEVLGSSFMHCHVGGLHSVVLLDQPGKRIRLFVAAYGHQLWKNSAASEQLSLGYHRHHCDLRLVGVRGHFVNRTASLAGGGGWRCDLRLNRYEYGSRLLGAKAGFRLLGHDTFTGQGHALISPGDCVAMRAQDIHTVYVDEGCVAAWLVFEGAEDPEYRPVTWSNDDLTTWSAGGLYEPMTEEQAERCLAMAGVL